MQRASEFKNPYNIIFSVLAAVAVECGMRVHYNGDIFGSAAENYIEPINCRSVVLMLLFAAVIYFVICFFEPVAFGYVSNQKAGNGNSKKIMLFWTIVIIVLWAIYYLSFLPGGIYSDTLISLNYAADNTLTNRHPFAYNCIIWFFVHLGYFFNKSLFWSFSLLFAFQMLCLAGVILAFIKWMVNRSVPTILRIISASFLVFFPLVPLYGVSIWKDTPFCMAVLLWMMPLTDLFHGEQRKHSLLSFVLGIVLVAFTRNNGIYVCAFAVLVMLFALKKNNKTKILAVVSVVLCFIIQGPVYNCIGVKQTEPVENFGVPLQQVGAVIAEDGVITEEQSEFLNNLLPADKWKASYCPTDIDNFKWYSGFNAEYFNSHIGDFMKVWLGLLRQNPGIFIRAYLMDTLGYWDIFESSPVAYVQTSVWPNSRGIESRDLFESLTGLPFRSFVMPKHYFSAAILFWVFFFSTMMSMKRFGARSLFLFAPLLGIWLSVMIASPIAFSLRYLAPLMFCLPFPLMHSWRMCQKNGD